MSDKPKRGRRTKNEMIKQNLINLVVEVTNVTNAATNEVTNATNEVTNATNDVTNATNDVTNDVTNEVSTEPEPHVSKKRGRKPKGGKIIQQNILNDSHKEIKSNIILHLKCSLKDLQSTTLLGGSVDSFNFSSCKNDFSFEVIKTVEYIDTQQLLIYESCCMDEYDSITNGYNTQHSVTMFDLY